VTAMAESDTTKTFGLSDDDLATIPTVYRDDLFSAKVALISGGAGAIGRATAWLLARLGAHVIVTGRTNEKLDAAAQALQSRGLSAEALSVDIRDPEAAEALFAEVWARHGRLDLVVNSAGGQFPQAAIDFSVKGWNAVIDTNLNGTWHMMQSAARQWRSQGQPGSIINIVVVTTGGLYGVAHSAAARAGVIELSKNVAVEWAPDKIRVNCIAPGTIESEGWAVYAPETRAAYPNANPMLRAGNTWDIAEACLYLGGPSGGFITGALLPVDGGGQHWGETWTTGKPDYFSAASAAWDRRFGRVDGD